MYTNVSTCDGDGASVDDDVTERVETIHASGDDGATVDGNVATRADTATIAGTVGGDGTSTKGLSVDGDSTIMAIDSLLISHWS